MEVEQGGTERAGYGEHLLEKLSVDLTARFGWGFSLRNLKNFRSFYLALPIGQTVSAQFNSEEMSPIRQTASGESSITTLAA